MTERQQSIILTSIIGTILAEYKGDKENTPAIKELKRVCNRFMTAQSGVIIRPFLGTKVVDKQKHINFLNSIKIGDAIWRKAVTRYASQGITIDAVSVIVSIWEFRPEVLAKHVHISKRRIDDYINESKFVDSNYKTNGAVIGGYLIELLSEEMGSKINGRLRALKSKVQRELGAVA